MQLGVCSARILSSKKELQLARALGKEIAKAGFEIVTGATIGGSLEAVRGAKEAGGKAFGVSPAKNEKEHIEKFGYPVKEFEEIEYTGKGFLHRNILLVQRASAVIFVGGSVGTLNEFSIALQQKKIIGVLENVSGVSGSAKKILEIIGLENYKKIFSSANPKELIQIIKTKL